MLTLAVGGVMEETDTGRERTDKLRRRRVRGVLRLVGRAGDAVLGDAKEY